MIIPKKGIFLFLLVLLTAIGCKDKTAVPTLDLINPAISNYLSAYTSGVISRTEPIIIRLAEPSIQEGVVGQQVANGILKFTPNLPGTATWEDAQTIKFTPNNMMPSGTTYKVDLAIGQLFGGVEKELQDFAFNFKTRDQFYSVRLNGLNTPDLTDLSKQSLAGSIRTSDFADNGAVEKILSAKQKGNSSVNVNWEHSADGQTHDFVVESVKRGDKASELELDWNGSPIQVDKKGSQTVEVPMMGDFKITNAVVVQENEQYILLQFSDPIMKTQNLDGLISIKGYSGDLRFVIDGNQVRVYPANRLTGAREINVTEAIKNTENYRMKDASQWFITFEDIKPQVRLVGKGVIIPNSEGLIFPFESVNLHSVDVEIFKIYSNNIIQFLQVNELAGDYQLSRVGKVVYQKQVPLKDLNPDANYSRWERFALDLTDLVEEDPNAIYQVRLGFQKSYSTYYCKESIDDEGIEEDYSSRSVADEDGYINSFYDYRYRYWNYEGYRWDHREDPCYPPYYGVQNFVARNVVASDLGLIAKRGEDGTVSVAVTSLTTAQPVSGASLEFYDYQQQLIGSVTSDGQGMATLQLERKPFVLIARSNNIRGYLKLNDGESVSLSRFDVSGARPQKGLKGYIYGERGVWRPGDSLYLTFILEDKKQTLPEGHPISLEFIDARGNLKAKAAAQTNRFQMYPFGLATADDDPTGNWQVKIKVGGATFSKTIKIETVKPNRLKVRLDFGTDELVASGDLNGQLQVNWLHGAPAQNLRTQIDYQVYSVNTTFPKYPEFEFDDPARRTSYSPQTLFDGQVNEQGQATVNGNLNIRKSAPGKMKVNFSLRAFEKGGDFSSDNFSMPYSPYEQYAGIRIPKNKWGSKRFEIDKENELEVALVDKDGNPVANTEVSVGLYKVKWRWWWENSYERNTNFASSTHYGSMKNEVLTTNSKGEVKWKVKPDDWGRYLIRVCDPASGHCSGDYFYAGYPWYGDDENSKKAAAILAFNSDKETYKIGETVKLSIPSSQQGRALISIENGSRVVESYWTDLKDGETNFQFYATEEMTPTVYANVSLIQPHGQTENDMPIRMYGVIPIKVENPDTKLEPEIKMTDVLRPEKPFTVEVSEKNKKGMSYTLAVVDEGLLDLTRFKTPDPWNSFYAREALGVKTWDVYDYVLGAYGGELERVLSIGGDGEAGSKGGQKANRFKPVVTHLGPFYLKPGQKAKHEITMPNYVGSVRTMVVASNSDGAYGNTEKTSPVRNPLMVLATLPRVLGPGEIVELPVNVFAMEDKVKNVDVKIEVNDKLEILGPSSKNVRFNQIGDEIIYFRLQVKESLGIAEVKVNASGNGEKASQEIELDVRNPNPYITDVLQAVLQPGEDWTQAFTLPGMQGTNSATLELSTFPPIDLGRRMRYLIRYPHGCVEQTTSGAFPQLYLSKLVELSDEQAEKTKDNVRAGLNRLRNFQTASGGFGYWPGDNAVNYWGNTYAGHFILEAKALGYTLPPNMLDRWKSAQRKAARNWTPITNRNDYRYRNDALQQSYRLYTLALAGSPELGAMNRLRERPNLPKTAKWRLAAAYAQAGKVDVAKVLVKDIDTKVEQYQELGYSYGSSLRDRAMILETLVLIGDKTTAAEMAKDIAASLSSNRWHSTQTIAQSLMAIGKFLEDNPTQEGLSFEYAIGNSSMKNAGANAPITQIDLDANSIGNSTVKVKNSGAGVLYGRLILQGQPIVGDSTSSASKLKMAVKYRAMDGSILDPTAIPQGTDFIAEVAITNPGQFGYYEEMALSQVFPSGWEIRNTRMDNVSFATNATRAEYQDFRDDRVYSYFDISSGQQQLYKIQLNAAYTGRYYMPTVTCEAMYDNTINARQAGKWVEVTAPEGFIQ